MVDAERLDALLICVPPFAHGPPELAAAELGLPFFVEKPVAADLDTAERIGRAVDDARLVSAVGYHWRYLDTTQRARELLADRPAHLVSGFWWDATPPRAWWVRAETSGGQIVEQTTHLVDLARVLVGEPVAVGGLAARVARREPSFPDIVADVPDATIATLRFAGGAIGSFSSTSLLRWPHRIALHLVSEALVIELTEFEIRIDDGRPREVVKATVDPFRAELRDFLAAAGGGPNGIRTPFSEALRTHRVTIAMTGATEAGRTIDLPPETGRVAARASG
jgi:predicted dehydrogenase